MLLFPMQAAREDAPAGAPMPHQLGGDEMLLAIVHPKVGWKPLKCLALLSAA